MAKTVVTSFMHLEELAPTPAKLANLSEANLFGADLSRASLSEADLDDADLSGANLSSADLTGADFLFMPVESPVAACRLTRPSHKVEL